MGGPFGLSGGIFLLVVEYFSDEYDPNTLSASGMSLEGERVGGIGTPKIGLCRGGRGFFSQRLSQSGPRNHGHRAVARTHAARLCHRRV